MLRPWVEQELWVQTALDVLRGLARGSAVGAVLGVQPRASRPSKRRKKQTEHAPRPSKLAPEQIEQEAEKKLALVMSLRRSARAQRIAVWRPTFRRSELLEVSVRGEGGGFAERM